MASAITGAGALVSSRAVGAAESGGVKQALLGVPGRVQLIPVGSSTVISFDVSVSETHSRDANPTAFPLEDGRTISDHIVVAPFELTLNGLITDTPIGGLAGYTSEVLTTALTAFAGPLGVTAAAASFAVANALNKSPSPSAIAFAQLLKLQAGEPDATPAKAPPLLDVVTSLRRYPSMVIKSISVPRDATTGKALKFTLVLTQLTVVSPQTVDVTVFRNSGLSSNEGKLGEKDGKPGQFDAGVVAGETDTANAAAKLKSFGTSASDLFTNLGSAF